MEGYAGTDSDNKMMNKGINCHEKYKFGPMKCKTLKTEKLRSLVYCDTDCQDFTWFGDHCNFTSECVVCGDALPN